MILENFVSDTASDGPMKWLTKKCGHELGLAVVDLFLSRPELRNVGKTMNEMVALFAFHTQYNWEAESDNREGGFSQEVKDRCSVS